MKVNFIRNNVVTNSKKVSFTGYKCPIAIQQLSEENLSDVFEFIKPSLKTRGDKQCFFESLYLYVKSFAEQQKTNSYFLVAKDNFNNIISTAGTILSNHKAIQSPLLGCQKIKINTGDIVQEYLINNILKFAKDKGGQLYVPTWCNAMDEVSLKTYKKYNLDISNN